MLRPLNSFDLEFEERNALEGVLEQLQDRSPSGWLPYRIMFRNFWFFTSEVFLILRGRIFLGGQNSAGKSTVLSMCIPFLLDGDKSEERLNTFGGKGRHMSYYVTGTSDLSVVDQDATALYSFPFRTSYVALEFRRINAEGKVEYVTIGQGLSHNRDAKDKDVHAWGFVCERRRIGIRDDGGLFEVIHPETGVSLSKGELKRLIESEPNLRCGKVFDTNRDYSSEVNQRLFGYVDPADYDALVNMLVRIRRPKLSQEGKPSVVTEFLSGSLPRLSPEVMATTAASLSHIDQTTENIGRLNNQIKAASELDRDLQSVFRLLALGEAARYKAAQLQTEETEKRLWSAENDLELAAKTIAEQKAAQAIREQQEAALTSEAGHLRDHDASKAHSALPETRHRLTQTRHDWDAKNRELRLTKINVERLKGDESRRTEDWRKTYNRCNDEVELLAEGANQARWALAEHWGSSLRSRWTNLSVDADHLRILGDLPREAAAKLADERVETVRKYDQLVANAEEAQRDWEYARSAEQDAIGQFRLIDARRAQYSSLFEDQRRVAMRQLEEALGSCRSISVPPSLTAAAGAALAEYSYQPGLSPARCLQIIRPLVDAAEQTCNDQEVAIRGEIATLERAQQRLQAELDALQDALPTPPRSEARSTARRLLTEHDIPTAPLYETLMPTLDADGNTVGVYEQALLDMGLLDALVVFADDIPRVTALLQDHHLADTWVAGPTKELGIQFLPICPDPQHPLAAAAGSVLAGLADGHLLSIATDGRWMHGLIAGVTTPTSGCRYLGHAARERFRLQEQRRLTDAMTEVLDSLTAQKEALTQTGSKRRELRSEWQELQELPEFKDMQTLGAELDACRVAGQQLGEQLEALSAKTEAARDRFEATQVPIQQFLMQQPELGGLDRTGLASLIERTRDVAQRIREIHIVVELLRSHRQAVFALREQQQAENSRVETLEEEAERLGLAVRDTEGKERALQRLIDSPDARTILDRLNSIDSELSALAKAQKEGLLALGASTDRLQTLEASLPSLREATSVAKDRSKDRRRRFQIALAAYPSLQVTYNEYLSTEDPASLMQAATHLLARRDDRANLVDEIDEDLRKANNTLSRTFTNTESTLASFFPRYDPEERTDRLVRCQVEGVSLTPYALLSRLREMAQDLRTVLSESEAALFGKHIMREMGREVRLKLLKANDWVHEMNDILARHPLANGEHVELSWEPKRSRDETGGLIAQHVDLLWIDDDHRTPVQRDTLRSAFEAEVNLIRDQARRHEWRSDVFREKLEKVLDYRIWFQFRIFVAGGVDGRQEITDTKHNAGSGSERSMVPLLALLAGLSSSYRSARVSAPKLVALDEAFAGLDMKNGQVLIRALVDLDFAWIISSEKRPPFTRDLSGATFYLMLRDGMDTGARALIWNGTRLISEEDAFGGLTNG